MSCLISRVADLVAFKDCRDIYEPLWILFRIRGMKSDMKYQRLRGCRGAWCVFIQLWSVHHNSSINHHIPHFLAIQSEKGLISPRQWKPNELRWGQARHYRCERNPGTPVSGENSNMNIHAVVSVAGVWRSIIAQNGSSIRLKFSSVLKNVAYIFKLKDLIFCNSQICFLLHYGNQSPPFLYVFIHICVIIISFVFGLTCVTPVSLNFKSIYFIYCKQMEPILYI